MEGLKYSTSLDGEKRWYLGVVQISPAHAADLLVQGVVKTVRTRQGNIDFGGHPQEYIERVTILIDGLEYEGDSPTLPQAVALAMHRMLDAKEASRELLERHGYKAPEQIHNLMIDEARRAKDAEEQG